MRKLLIVAVCMVAFVAISPAQIPGIVAPPDTVTIGLPSIAVPHALTVTLMTVFGVLLAISEFFGLNKSIQVNSVLGWVYSFIKGAMDSLKNAHNGTPEAK